MKKVFFGILGLGAIVSLVVVMSCGGSSSGTAPTDAGSVAVAASVATVMSSGGNPIIGEIGVNEDVPLDSTVDCPVSGTVAVTGNLAVGDTSVTGTIVEVMNNCAVEDAAPPKGCGFGDVVGNGTVNCTIDASGSSSSYNVTETMKATAMTFGYHKKTLTCDMDLTLHLDSSTTWTEDNIASAVTGTVCGVDWAQIQVALKDSTEMAKLCTALDTAATEL